MQSKQLVDGVEVKTKGIVPNSSTTHRKNASYRALS